MKKTIHILSNILFGVVLIGSINSMSSEQFKVSNSSSIFENKQNLSDLKLFEKREAYDSFSKQDYENNSYKPANYFIYGIIVVVGAVGTFGTYLFASKMFILYFFIC